MILRVDIQDVNNQKVLNAFGRRDQLTGAFTAATKAQVEDELRGFVLSRVMQYKREQREAAAAIEDAQEVL